MVRLLYFAWLREQVGVESEELDLPHSVATGRDLIAYLSDRHPHAAEALGRTNIKIALDQTVVAMEASVANAKEIALFPPMTGG